MAQRILGVLVILHGLIVLGWVGYNLFIEMQPEARGRSPYPAIVCNVALIGFGLWLLRSRLWLTWDRVFRPIFGVCGILIGTATLGWVGYNLLVEAQPEWRKAGSQVVRPIAFSLTLIGVGLYWLRRKKDRARDKETSPSDVPGHPQG